MSIQPSCPTGRASPPGTRVFYFAPIATGPLNAVVRAATGPLADPIGADSSSLVTAEILIWQPLPLPCQSIARQTAVGWTIYDVPRVDDRHHFERLPAEFRAFGRWSPVGVNFHEAEINHEPIGDAFQHHVHPFRGRWFYSHGNKSAGPFDEEHDAQSYAIGRQLDPERLIPAEIPFRLHPAFAWISTGGEADLLATLEGDALIALCCKIARAAAQAGVNEVREEHVMAIVRWQREEQPRHPAQPLWMSR